MKYHAAIALKKKLPVHKNYKNKVSCPGIYISHHEFGIVMSTIPKRKYKRSDIEANYRNETKTFWCVPKKEVERFYWVQKLGNEIRTKSGLFYVV